MPSAENPTGIQPSTTALASLEDAGSPRCRSFFLQNYLHSLKFWPPWSQQQNSHCLHIIATDWFLLLCKPLRNLFLLKSIYKYYYYCQWRHSKCCKHCNGPGTWHYNVSSMSLIGCWSHSRQLLWMGRATYKARCSTCCIYHASLAMPLITTTMNSTNTVLIVFIYISQELCSPTNAL